MLYLVRHSHKTDNCPAENKDIAPMLLKHLSKQNAAQYGISLHGEAVINGEHTLYLILESDTAEKVKEFMKPFSRFGDVEIKSASPCEVVVERGRC